MRFPCMIDHDRMSLYGGVVYSLHPQPQNRGQVLAQEDPMDLDLHPPVPQGQFPRSQTLQQPQESFGSFRTAGPSIQNPISSPTKPGQYQEQFPSTVFPSPISSTTELHTNNSTDSQRQSTAMEGRGLKRKGSTFGEPSQPSKVPRYLEKQTPIGRVDKT